MRKSFFACSLFLCSFFITISCNTEKHGHKSTKLPGNWQATPVVADGRQNEWPSPLPYNNNKAMISYDISNDKDNLYVIVVSGDAATELKILRKGIVVWIDKNGTQEEKTSICYPSDNDKGPIRQGARNQSQGGDQSQGQQGQGKDLMQAVDKSISTADEFFLQGFKGCNGKYYALTGDSCKIKVACGLDEYDQLVWEAVIPFKAFYTKTEIDNRDKGRPISVCFDMLGLDKPAGQGNSGHGGGSGMHMGGMGFGMGGMGMGMGMHPGGGGGRRSGGTPNEQLYTSYTFWPQVGIAYQDSTQQVVPR
jgi:hypothetical protein